MIPVYIYDGAVNKKNQPHPDAVLTDLIVKGEKEEAWVINFPDAWAILNFVNKLKHRVLLCPPREEFDYWAIMYDSNYKNSGVGFKQR